jgi:hypothetical protein
MNHALSNQVYLLELYKTLSASNTSIRASIKENKVFKNLKFSRAFIKKHDGLVVKTYFIVQSERMKKLLLMMISSVQLNLKL